MGIIVALIGAVFLGIVAAIIAMVAEDEDDGC